MDHKLQLLVRLDIDRGRAVIQVNGCLTQGGYQALVPLVRRTRSLAGGLPVLVDLSSAQHIDVGAFDHLERFTITENTTHSQQISINAPSRMPGCPALSMSTRVHEPAAS